MNTYRTFEADSEFEGAYLDIVIEKLCSTGRHQHMIGYLSAAFYYANKDHCLDLLQNALQRKCAACCDLLLNFSNGVHVNEESFFEENNGMDPIIECMFLQLIDLVTPKNWTVTEAEFAMLLAIRLDQIDVVKMLLEKYPVLVNVTTIYGQSILIHALICKAFEIAAYLLEITDLKNGATCNTTALTVSCFTKGCPIKIVTTLLECIKKKMQFIPKSVLLEPLYYAAKFRRLDIIKLILEEDQSLINEPLNGHGYYLLHCVLIRKMNREEILNYLFNELSTQINVMPQTLDGNTVLHLSIMHDMPLHWIKKFLEMAPELAHQPNHKKVTPLMIAVQDHNFEVTEILVKEFQVDVNALDSEGKSVLDHCIDCDSVEILKWLLEFGGINTQAKNQQGNTVFSELFKSLRYGVNDYEEKIEMLCFLMAYTYNESNFKETFEEIFNQFNRSIQCLSRFEVLQSWIYTCYITDCNPYKDIVRRFVEEFELEGYPSRNAIVLCLHGLIPQINMDRAVHIRVSEELGRCVEDAIYEQKDLDLIIKIAEILKKNDAVSCGISMRQKLFFPEPPFAFSTEHLRDKLKQFYIAFNKLGFINLDKTVKFCMSEILFNSQQPFENKVYQLKSGILQAQMELMTEEPAPSMGGIIELSMNFLSKEDVYTSKEFNMVKTYLNPKYINLLTEGREMLPIETLCRSAFRRGLFEKCKAETGDEEEAKQRFYKIMEAIDIPLRLKNFLNYQYKPFRNM